MIKNKTYQQIIKSGYKQKYIKVLFLELLQKYNCLQYVYNYIYSFDKKNET